MEDFSKTAEVSILDFSAKNQRKVIPEVKLLLCFSVVLANLALYIGTHSWPCESPLCKDGSHPEDHG